MNVVKVSLAFTIIAVCTAGCMKDPEKQPLNQLTEGNVFDTTDATGAYALEFLNNIFSTMPSGFNRIGGDMLDDGDDDAMPSAYGTAVEKFTNGEISPLSNPDNAWGTYYTGIRNTNLFLSEIGRVPMDSLTKQYWKADARFLRALFYFQMLRAYGGIPIIGDTVYKLTDIVQPARNTFADCVRYIVSECNAISGLERPDPVITTDWGRGSRGAVLTLKAQVLLYAASPLFNGVTGVTGAQAALQGYPTYDASRWDSAAQAAKAVIALNAFSLDASYSDVFLSRRNSEVILAHLRGTTDDIETQNGPVGYANLGAGQGRTSPTQELVDAFQMKNGKNLSDPSSGYDSTNPYVNRDPRFAYTILYNGAKWLGRPIQTYEGGLDKPNTNIVQTQTGYYMGKFMGSFASSSAYSAQNHNFVIYRYADVLLWYAEALNEYEGPVQDVYTSVEAVRKRAGLSPYQLPVGLTQDQMREVIRHERRVEFAFEEERFWDIRRWKTAAGLLNGTLTGMKITLGSNNSVSYQRFPAEITRFPDPAMYLYPIPYSELSINRNLIQNSGW
jgi:hypothetical protein